MQEIQASFRGHLIRSEDGRAIGRIRKNTAGKWRAIAFAGCSSDEIDAVMDACQELFQREIDPPRCPKIKRWETALRLVGARRRA